MINTREVMDNLASAVIEAKMALAQGDARETIDWLNTVILKAAEVQAGMMTSIENSTFST